MSEHDDRKAPGPDDRGDEERDRYVALGTTENKVVIFDRDEDRAWVKGDNAVAKEEMV